MRGMTQYRVDRNHFDLLVPELKNRPAYIKRNRFLMGLTRVTDTRYFRCRRHLKHTSDLPKLPVSVYPSPAKGQHTRHRKSQMLLPPTNFAATTPNNSESGKVDKYTTVWCCTR